MSAGLMQHISGHRHIMRTSGQPDTKPYYSSFKPCNLRAPTLIQSSTSSLVPCTIEWQPLKRQALRSFHKRQNGQHKKCVERRLNSLGYCSCLRWHHQSCNARSKVEAGKSKLCPVIIVRPTR